MLMNVSTSNKMKEKIDVEKKNHQWTVTDAAFHFIVQLFVILLIEDVIMEFEMWIVNALNIPYKLSTSAGECLKLTDGPFGLDDEKEEEKRIMILPQMLVSVCIDMIIINIH